MYHEAGRYLLVLFMAQLGEPFLEILIFSSFSSSFFQAKPALKSSKPALKWTKPALKRPNRHLKNIKKSAKTKRGRREGDGKKMSRQFATTVTTIYDMVNFGSSRVGSKASVGYGTPPP